MQIFWISVTAALSDTFLMFSTIPFLLYQAHQQPQGSQRFSYPTFSVIIIIIIIKQ